MRAYLKDGAIVNCDRDFHRVMWKDDGTVFKVEETPNYFRLRGTDSYGKGCLYLPKSCEEELLYIKEEEMNYKFYMVLVDGTGSTRQKHTDIQAARNEAARLLGLSNVQGQGATILQAIEYVRPIEAPVDIHVITAAGSLGKKIQ